MAAPEGLAENHHFSFYQQNAAERISLFCFLVQFVIKLSKDSPTGVF